MLGKCFGVLTVISLAFALLLGNTQEVALAAVDGASKAVSVIISLMGMTSLWCGVMRVFQKAGLVEKLSRVLSPILRLIFPTAFRSGTAKEEITSAVTANLLGIGNAATPFALSAMKKMDDKYKSTVAAEDMIMLSVIAASPVCIIPTTLITLRRAAGSVFPFKIIVPVWIGSVCSFTFAVILCRLCAVLRKNKG